MSLLPDLKRKISYVDRAFLEDAVLKLADQIALQKTQLFLYLPVLLGTGIGFYFALPAMPPLVLGLLTTCILIAALFLLSPYKEQSVNFQLLWLTLLSLALVSGGFLAASYRTSSINAPMLEKELAPVSVRGVIEDIEDLGEGEGSRIILKNLMIEKLSEEKTPRKIRIKVRDDTGLEVGQEVDVLAGLNPPSGPSIPGGFDFRRYSYFQGIGALGFSYKPPGIIRPSTSQGISSLIDSLRHNIGQRIERATNYPEAGIIAALIIGKRTAIGDEDYGAIRDAGLAHMLAISGLHVGLFSAVFFFFSRLVMAAIPGFALRHPIKKYAAVIGIAAAVFYMLLAGSTIPAQRAAMMSCIVFLAIIFDRSPLSLRLVAFSAFVVLLFSPQSLLSVSFQMSFAAVTALIVFFDSLRGLWSKFYYHASWPRRLALYFLGVCLTTVIASLATAPFALFHFQKLALYSLLSNFVAMPLLALIIMPFSVLALLLMPVGLDTWPLYIVSKGVTGMLDIAHWTAALEGAVLHVTQWPEIALVLITFTGLGLVLVKGSLKMIAVIPAVFLLLAVSHYRMPDIVLSGNHKIMAYSPAAKHLSVSTKRREAFTRENWERLYGIEEGGTGIWPKEGTDTSGMTCGEEGCRFYHSAYKVAFSASPESHKEDCSWADVLIAEDPVDKTSCTSRVIIDKFDTWRHGAHGIWLNGSPPLIRRVNDETGNWPWSERR